MTNRRSAAGLTIALLLAGLSACSAHELRTARDARPSEAIQARLLEHRRRTEEGERLSRALRPSVPPPAPAANGTTIFPVNNIIQFPINTGVTIPFFKQTAPLPPSVPPCPYTPGANPRARTASLVKVFPEVTWHVCVTDMGLKSLWVGPVHRAPNIFGPWTTVLHQAGLADILVPYHQTSFRPYDLVWTANLDQVTAQDAGLTGSLIYLTNETIPTVVAEVRDRGVAWMCKETTMASRRAQEFVVWGVADGGNYDNIIEYTFRDDGGIAFRLGNTGYNSPDQPQEPHTHTALWRVDIDLNGAIGDVPWWLTHQEPYSTAQPSRAFDPQFLITNEGRRGWNGQMASLLVTDSANNAFGQKQGYEFSPTQTATLRHFGAGETWTHNDVYVTRHHPWELTWTAVPPGVGGPPPDTYLIPSLNNEPTVGQDIVIWVKTAAHHHPTDEDRSAGDLGTTNTTGVTLAHWSGFKMDPYNVFNANPMGGPARCGP